MTVNNNTDDFTKMKGMQQLAHQVVENAHEVEKNLDSFDGIVHIWLSGLQDQMPDWAARYIDIYKQLEQGVQQIKVRGEEVPEEVADSYYKGKETLQKLAAKVNAQAYLQAVTPGGKTVGNHGLLRGDFDLPKAHEQWHLNLGLLMNAHAIAQEPAVKRRIEFLALNYLAKAAPVNIKELGISDSLKQLFEDSFQYGPMTEPMTYHRETSVFEKILEKEVASTFAKDSQGWFWLTDTIRYDDFLPLNFTVLQGGAAKSDESLVQEWSKQVAAAFLGHWQNHAQEPYSTFLDLPVLFDLTALLGDVITTHGDANLEQAYVQKKNAVDNLVEESLKKALQQFKADKPEIVNTPEEEKKWLVFARFNMIAVCRCILKKSSEGPEVGVLKKLNVFKSPEYFALPEEMFKDKVKFLHLEQTNNNAKQFARSLFSDQPVWAKSKLETFINHTGLRIGAVSAREKIFNFVSLEDILSTTNSQFNMTEYAVGGANPLYFPEKDAILNTEVFKRFQSQIQQHSADHPEVAILGQATVKMLQGLSKEITADKWAELNAHTASRMILQQSLYRLMTHLTAAENHIADFTRFSQAIELMHSEVATILTLVEPFTKADFENIYKDRLKIVPENLRQHLEVGIAKSAMNAFAGINVAVKKMHSEPERVYGANAYFEEVDFVGFNRSIAQVVSDNSIKGVDLYVGEFNHNVIIHMSHNHYTPGKIIEDVDLLLAKKTDTQHLTVSVDFTIDFVNSPQAQRLLEHFSDKIQEGKLNFVFFASGQKFDMLGLDSYYGAPFWMVNNGDKIWADFEALRKHEAYQTDPLTLQWFCLANKYAPKELDLYKKQIFDNAREILRQIPEELKPNASPHQILKVSTVDKDMQPAFIDIKVLNDTPEKTTQKIERLLYQKFGKQGVKIHSRGSFGFYHPNFNIIVAIEDKRPRNVRINPGLDPRDNALIVEFIKELPKKL